MERNCEVFFFSFWSVVFYLVVTQPQSLVFPLSYALAFLWWPHYSLVSP